jgi:hypothetical protein
MELYELMLIPESSLYAKKGRRPQDSPGATMSAGPNSPPDTINLHTEPAEFARP